MDSSASDSRKEIACISNFSKLSPKKTHKKNTQKNKKTIIILVNIVTYLFFITFLMCKKSKESRNQSMLMPSKQSWVLLQLQL